MEVHALDVPHVVRQPNDVVCTDRPDGASQQATVQVENEASNQTKKPNEDEEEVNRPSSQQKVCKALIRDSQMAHACTFLFFVFSGSERWWWSGFF